ncbi:MAG: hypothetical protein JWO22_3701 [Frankiales bacterium]|nr:hypothetical protein [Frankiales bacterium]
MRRVAALLVVAALVGSCNQEYRQDKRLSITAPRDGARVSAPLSVSWTMRDFDATGLDGSTSPRQGAYAVFVDRAPMPPGKDLRWLGRKDRSCRSDVRCVDAAFLANLGVYVTAQTSVTLPRLPQVDAQRGIENHTLTVVLLDGSGHRIGEKAWYRNFESRASA